MDGACQDGGAEVGERHPHFQDRHWRAFPGGGILDLENDGVGGGV